MPRVTTGPATRKRRKKWLKRAKGYWGAKSKLYKTARLQVMKALQSAYRERKRKKRTFRSLWIVRINAALKPHNLSYSKFINGLKLAGIEMNRKTLSELAVRSPKDFDQIVTLVKSRLESEKSS
ncbi:MAG: 50S ribosomal protein L20 [candidate division WOR-3 bacterium]|nr:50S ribosomal protein L20 [candidate division WOR-3 bacterium]